MIRLENVSKSFASGNETLRVLRGLDLKAAEGESVAVVGESGSGKSTLLNIIGGLDKPDEGLVFSCGYEVQDLDEKGLTSYRSLHIGFVFQFHYLLKDFTALENVMLPALMAGRSRKSAMEGGRELLNRVRVSERKDHFPSQLSGGERQRVALARALVNRPSLILADEPTGNLDEAHKSLVTDLLFELTVMEGKTLLFVTHALDLAGRSDRTFSLEGGKLSAL